MQPNCQTIHPLLSSLPPLPNLLTAIVCAEISFCQAIVYKYNIIT